MNIWKTRVPSALHCWFDSKPSSSACDIGEHNCLGHNSESRIKCGCCHVVVHEKCLQSRQNFTNKCKETYISHNNAFDTNDPIPEDKHQFEMRLKSKGKCSVCKKQFSKSFGGKKIYVLQCIWCKDEVHSTPCFTPVMNDQACHTASYVIPTSWMRKKKPTSPHRQFEIRFDKKCPFSVFQGISNKTPIVLFINKKSGGGQYEKLYKQALWLLNPRQIFDLAVSSPKLGLHLFKHVKNCIVVVAGGDGTVGWILSTATEMGLDSVIPMGIIPLGTGNDLARSFNWGSGYTTESLVDIFSDMITSPVCKLDRWSLTMECSRSDSEGSTVLPIDVMNNYFSIGADARIALGFHESRNANPGKFNSRFWNKIYYAGVGGKDMIVQSCKDLSEFCVLKCDDTDLTKKLLEKKISTLLFLNIDSYSGGRNPWGNPTNSAFKPQSCSDGLIEVIGFTYGSMVSTQLGGTGYRFCQCRQADVTLLRDLPVQVDGEPCLLAAGQIFIRLLGQVNIVHRNNRRHSPHVLKGSSPIESRLGLNQQSCSLNCTLSPMSKSTPIYWIADSFVLTDTLLDTKSLKTKSNYCGEVLLSLTDNISFARKLINKHWMPEWTVTTHSWNFVKIDSSGGYVLSKLEEEDECVVGDWLVEAGLFAV